MNNPKEKSVNLNAESDDCELIAAAQKGNHDAFGILVDRYRGKVYAMIVNMIHSEADAWDLAQDTFVKAWKALPRFEARSKFYTWVYRIAHNVTYDWLRKKKVRGDGVEFDDNIASLQQEGAPTALRVLPQPDELAEASDIGTAIRHAISKLSEDHRAYSF